MQILSDGQSQSGGARFPGMDGRGGGLAELVGRGKSTIRSRALHPHGSPQITTDAYIELTENLHYFIVKCVAQDGSRRVGLSLAAGKSKSHRIIES